ncbi:hypothetical protein BH09BAC5_BH09BAC5_05510 [soil metagenome]
MKTFISILITAMFLAIAVPASARKQPAVNGCPANAHSAKSNKKHSKVKPYRSVTSQHLEFKKQHRKFEKPKSRFKKRGKNPNKHSTNYKSGGFWSFRNHSYSAHVFH